MPDEELYTTQEAAEYCGLTQHNIRFYVRKGTLVPDKGVGRMLIFKKSTLDEFKKLPRAPVGRPKESDRKRNTN